MPEGHKTHYLAGLHRERLAGQSLRVTSPQGRFADDAKKVDRRMLATVNAAGKHLFYEFDGDTIIHIHLGRYGSFAEQSAPPSPPVGQVRMRLVGDRHTIDLRGPTQCRVIDKVRQESILASLGPDPLAGGRKQDVAAKLRSSSKPVAALMLDQSIIAGVGNIFRAEILFETGIDPHTSGCDLTDRQFTAIWKSTVAMMRKSLRLGKIVSVTRREVGKPLTALGDRERFRVYGQSHCPRCGTSIATETIASRKLYFCPSCQRSLAASSS